MKKMILMSTFILLVFTAAASAETFVISGINDGWINAKNGTGAAGGIKIDSNFNVTEEYCTYPTFWGCGMSADRVTDNVDRVYWGNGVSSWGVESFEHSSSYVWNSGVSIANPTLAAALDAPIELGTFTHNNKPLTGGYVPILESVSLSLGFNIGNDYFNTQVSDLLINFTHLESANKCADPSAAACADLTTIIDDAPFNHQFLLGEAGADTYYFTLLGFSPDGTDFNFEYITNEGTTGTTSLWGIITATPLDDRNPGGFSEISDVPEPSSILFLGTGILGLGLVARRKLGKK